MKVVTTIEMHSWSSCFTSSCHRLLVECYCYNFVDKTYDFQFKSWIYFLIQLFDLGFIIRSEIWVKLDYLSLRLPYTKPSLLNVETSKRSKIETFWILMSAIREDKINRLSVCCRVNLSNKNNIADRIDTKDLQNDLECASHYRFDYIDPLTFKFRYIFKGNATIRTNGIKFHHI